MSEPYTIVGGFRVWANGTETTLEEFDAACATQDYWHYYYADYTGPREIEARRKDQLINGMRLQLWKQGLKEQTEQLYMWYVEGERLGQPKPAY